MTLDDALAAYAAGLDSELALLRQVEALAAEQHDRITGSAFEEVASIADRRATLMADLAELERQLHPVRAQIVGNLPAARAAAGFGAASARHRTAEALVARIMAADRALVDQLQAALADRRELAHVLEAGGATLAAYRRVIAPGVGSASLVDRLG